MKFLTQEIRQKFLDASNKVGDLLKAGLQPAEAIKQAAGSYQLGPEFVKHLASVYNTMATLSQAEAPTLSEKIADVEIVNGVELAGEVEKMKSAESVLPDFYRKKVRDYMPRIQRPPLETMTALEKAASLEAKRPVEFKLTDLQDERTRLRRQRETIRSEMKTEMWDLFTNLRKTAALLSAKKAPPFDEVETRMQAAYGSSLYMDKLAQILQVDKRGVPTTRTLLTDFNAEPYCSLVEGFRLSKKLAAAMKKIELIDQEQEKIASSIRSLLPHETAEVYITGKTPIERAEKEAGLPFLSFGGVREQGRYPVSSLTLSGLAKALGQGAALKSRISEQEAEVEKRLEDLATSDPDAYPQARMRWEQEKLKTLQSHGTKTEEAAGKKKEQERKKRLEKSKTKGSLKELLSNLQTGSYSLMKQFAAPPPTEEAAARMELALKQKELSKERGFEDYFPPQHELEVNKIKAKALLVDILTTDPILKGYKEEEVIEAFNELVRTVPTVLESKPLAVSMLREFMERQHGMEATSLLDLIQKSRELSEAQKEERGG